MTHYCENQYCESEAVKQVTVSTEKAGDSKRWLCTACEQAFTWGVQHGTMTARSETGEFDNLLLLHIREYQAEIRPLRVDADAGKASYDQYDEAYDIWLESLHHHVEAYLRSKGLLCERKDDETL